MTLLDLTLSRPEPPVARLLAMMAARLDRRRRRPAAGADDARGRRAFVQEMLDRNPQAFACAEDLHAMMAQFPDRF